MPPIISRLGALGVFAQKPQPQPLVFAIIGSVEIRRRRDYVCHPFFQMRKGGLRLARVGFGDFPTIIRGRRTEAEIDHAAQNGKRIPVRRDIAMFFPPAHRISRLRADRSWHPIAKIIRASVRLAVESAEAKRGNEAVGPIISPVQIGPKESHLLIGVHMKAGGEEFRHFFRNDRRWQNGKGTFQFCQSINYIVTIWRIALRTRYANCDRMQVTSGGFSIIQQRFKNSRSPTAKWVKHDSIEARRGKVLLHKRFRKHREVWADGMEAVSHAAAAPLAA